MSATGIGATVRRKEDHRFITGKGHYTDDINRPGQSYAFFVRSPHAHATIKSIDTKAAAAMPPEVRQEAATLRPQPRQRAERIRERRAQRGEGRPQPRERRAQRREPRAQRRTRQLAL